MNQIIKHPAVLSGIILAFFAIIGTMLVSFTFQQTADQIKENERLALLKALQELIPASHHDNDILKDTSIVTSEQLTSSLEPTTIYHSRWKGKVNAVVFSPVVSVGYADNIKLLVGVNDDSTLAGVRVISHKETPGLGDGIDTDKSDWILMFAKHSLQNPPIERWKVKKDGGDFDQMTGATITPRTIVKAVKRALEYFSVHKKELLELPMEKTNG